MLTYTMGSLHLGDGDFFCFQKDAKAEGCWIEMDDANMKLFYSF